MSHCIIPNNAVSYSQSLASSAFVDGVLEVEHTTLTLVSAYAVRGGRITLRNLDTSQPSTLEIAGLATAEILDCRISGGLSISARDRSTVRIRATVMYAGLSVALASKTEMFLDEAVMDCPVCGVTINGDALQSSSVLLFACKDTNLNSIGIQSVKMGDFRFVNSTASGNIILAGVLQISRSVVEFLNSSSVVFQMQEGVVADDVCVQMKNSILKFVLYKNPVRKAHFYIFNVTLSNYEAAFYMIESNITGGTLVFDHCVLTGGRAFGMIYGSFLDHATLVFNHSRLEGLVDLFLSSDAAFSSFDTSGWGQFTAAAYNHSYMEVEQLEAASYSITAKGGCDVRVHDVSIRNSFYVYLETHSALEVDAFRGTSTQDAFTVEGDPKRTGRVLFLGIQNSAMNALYLRQVTVDQVVVARSSFSVFQVTSSTFSENSQLSVFNSQFVTSLQFDTSTSFASSSSVTLADVTTANLVYSYVSISPLSRHSLFRVSICTVTFDAVTFMQGSALTMVDTTVTGSIAMYATCKFSSANIQLENISFYYTDLSITNGTTVKSVGGSKLFDASASSSAYIRGDDTCEISFESNRTQEQTNIQGSPSPVVHYGVPWDGVKSTCPAMSVVPPSALKRSVLPNESDIGCGSVEWRAPHNETSSLEISTSRTLRDSRATAEESVSGRQPTATHTMPHRQSDSQSRKLSTTAALLSLTRSRPVATSPPAAPGPSAVMAGVTTPAVADAIAATATSATLVSAAVFSPSVASQMSRVGALVRAASCSFNEEDEAPSYLEQPLQPSIGASPVRVFVGGAVCSAALLVLFFAFHEKLKRTAASVASTKNRLPTRQLVKTLHFTSNCLAVSLSYFGAALIGSAATAVAHGETALDYGLALASASLALLIGVYCCWAFVARWNIPLWKSAAPAVDGASATEAGDQSSKPLDMTFIATYGEMVSATRVHRPTWASRVYFVEDLAAAWLIAAVGGARSTTTSSCTIVGVLLMVIATTHAGFVIRVRPYEEALDNWFAIAFAVNQVGLSIASLSSLHDARAMKVLAWLTVVQSSGFVLQTLAQLCVSCYETEHRRHANPSDDDTLATVLVPPGDTPKLFYVDESATKIPNNPLL